MTETMEQQQRRVGRFMTAVARTLAGDGSTLEDFTDRAELVVGGSLVDAPTLMQWAARTERSGRPIILFSPSGADTVPHVTLVARVDGQTHIVENCMLWMGKNDGRARLVPDNFQLGTFVFKDNLELLHLRRPPARNIDAAMPGMTRAYARLFETEVAIRKSGENTPMPSVLGKAA
jgi:hypothetical protein